MTDKLLGIIRQKWELTELPPCKEDGLKAGGMTFSIRSYRADGLGHISVMRAGGFCGLMRMDTLIVNPTELDLPLYSYDRIFVPGKDTLIAELYDTLIGRCDLSGLSTVAARFSDLAERDPGRHWYDEIKLPESISKKGKKPQRARMDELAEAHFQAYLSARAETLTEKDAKLKKASMYVEGLLQHGGPSTDVFLKAIGRERTKQLFGKVLFGTIK